MSFAHGANDIANAAALFSAIIAVWGCQCISKTNKVPTWILAMWASGMVLGLLTYGYRWV
jgi:phosphate/sulfate permease